MPSTACDQCYRRKTGCAGERPVCSRCTVAGLTCTYSTGRPVGKPKGHRKAKSCSASISQSTSPDQGSPPVPSIHATSLGQIVANAHTTSNAGSHGRIVESPVGIDTGTAGDLQHSSGPASVLGGGDPFFHASPGNTSHPSRSTASPYEQTIPRAGFEDAGYFTTTALPPNRWSESGGTLDWSTQTISAPILIGPTSGIADIPAFTLDAGIDHHWFQAMSVAPNAPGMMAQGSGSMLPCQCSIFLHDITSLFQCQVSMPRTDFDHVLQVIQAAVQQGQSSLDFHGCAAHGWPSVLTNIIVMLQQGMVCLQAILAIIDNDPCMASEFGVARGIKAEGYHLDSTELKRRVVYAVIERELDGMRQLAHAVRATAQIEGLNGEINTGILPLLVALDESLSGLRRSTTSSA